MVLLLWLFKLLTSIKNTEKNSMTKNLFVMGFLLANKTFLGELH